MKKYFSIALLAALVLTGCSAGPGGSSSSTGNKVGDQFIIGGDFELSGSVAAYGSAESEGVKLAVEQINKDGGINGKKVKYVEKDNKSENAEAASVANNLNDNTKIVAMVGPATTGAVQAVTPVQNKAGVPMITPSGTGDSLTSAGSGKAQAEVFRSCFEDSFQGKVLATFADDDLKAKKVVIFTDSSTDYSQGVTKAFKAAYKGKVVQEISYASGDKDFQAQLTKIKGTDFDAIFIPGYYTEAGMIIRQARELGITAPILGADGFSDAKLVETAGAKNVSNVYYSDHYSAKAPATDKVKPFIEAFKKKYGKEPSAFAALAYDAVYMIKQAAEDTNAKTSKDVTKGLENLKDFKGVTGVMTMKDHNPEKSAVVIGMTDGKESSAVSVTPK